MPIDLDNALSRENIRVSVPTTVTAAISVDPSLMANAAVRLLGLQQRRKSLAGAGHHPGPDARRDCHDGHRRDQPRPPGLHGQDERGPLGWLNEKIGLEVINVNVRDIDDESGYIRAINLEAAAEAVNQALVDVAEQERHGRAERGRARARRRAVAPAEAAAGIGEKEAERDRRRVTAGLDAEAVEAEAEAEARRRPTTPPCWWPSRKRADAPRRLPAWPTDVSAWPTRTPNATPSAARRAGQARLRAEVVVPTEANREQVVIAAEAGREQRAVLAEGEAAPSGPAWRPRPRAPRPSCVPRPRGWELVKATNGLPEAAASFLIIEKLVDVAASRRRRSRTCRWTRSSSGIAATVRASLAWAGASWA